MLDFIKSLDLSEELKTNEIYYLFKTDSSESNIQLLSTLQKFKTNKDFLNYYTNQECKSTIDIYDNISFISSEIIKGEEKINFKNDFENYISGISKIIFLFLLLQKHNELLNNLLMNTKRYINKFYDDFNVEKMLKKKINLCVNDLTCSCLISSKINYSRRPTKEGTIVSSKKLSISSLLKNKQQNISSNSYELIFSQMNTPRFEREENDGFEEIEAQKNSSKKVINEEIINRFDSNLTLSKMKFTLPPEEESIIIKEKSEKKKFNYNLIKDNNKYIYNIQLQKEDKNIELKNFDLKKQILAKFFDIINDLYKHEKINDEQKLSMKQILISDYNTIIDRFINL